MRGGVEPRTHPAEVGAVAEGDLALRVCRVDLARSQLAAQHRLGEGALQRARGSRPGRSEVT